MRALEVHTRGRQLSLAGAFWETKDPRRQGFLEQVPLDLKTSCLPCGRQAQGTSAGQQQVRTPRGVVRHGAIWALKVV